MPKLNLRYSSALVVCLSLTLGASLAAVADTRQAKHVPLTKKIAEEMVYPAKTWSAGEIAKKRAAQKMKARNDVSSAYIAQSVARAANHGLRLDPQTREYFDLDNAIAVVASKETDFSSISLKRSLGAPARNSSGKALFTANLEVKTEDKAMKTGTRAYWSTGKSDCFDIIFKAAKSTMQSCWYKKQLLSDADSRYDYWSYGRKAWSQNDEVSGVNWSTRLLKVYSNPSEGTSTSIFKSIEGRSPGSDFKGNCDAVPFSAAVPVKGIEIGLTFMDCNFYDVEWKGYHTMGNTMSQGTFFYPGNQEVAFMMAPKVSQGKIPSWSDYSRFEIARLVYSGKVCHGRDKDITCP